ncbi:MAG: penicillin-binding protein 1C [Kofleriaceae bacterium]
MWRTRAVRGALWLLAIINSATLVVFILAYAIALPVDHASASTVVEYRDGRPAHVFLSSDDKWRLPVALDTIDPKFIDSLTALEDQRFWDHAGVDPIAIGRAVITDVWHWRRVSGGSTISMQLARLLEPRARTIPNKLIDMFRAVQLDLRLSKREILERYLSRTPYGGNVEGIESAAWTYFGHAARHLTPLECATLLAVPQGPARFAPSQANEARLRARRDAILAKLVAAGVFTRTDAAQALADAAVTPPPGRLQPMPRAIPHAAIALRKRSPDRTQIRSTIDAGVQAIVERQVALRVPELHAKAIYGGAVVVVDHHTRELVALVGNLQFGDAAHGGQIAMFDRSRSPGSTLKPLLYALGIDRGLALPEFLVADVPSQYGTYRPQNFDHDWAGLVRLEDALSRSLNLPFVDLLDRLGVDTFITELQRMGTRLPRAQPGFYGLSLIAGSIEVTPVELAAMYATLAEGGTYQPVRWLTTDAPGPPTPVFGAGAAWLTRRALALKDRPDAPSRRATNGIPHDVHWKTGTSFGFRDAWAVGSSARYTAVVWTGNVDNTPSADLVGSEAAGPLLFDVLEGIATTRTPGDPRPADLTEVEVCAYSGHLAGEACDHRTTVYAPIHAVPTEPCPYHQAYEVDRATGHAVLPTCRDPNRSYDRKSFVVLPSNVTAWLTARERAIPPAPVFAESCGAGDQAPPEITTPGKNQVIALIPGLAATKQAVALSATTQSSTLWWFVDGELIASGPSSQRAYWTPAPGTHEIVVADEAGRKARRTLEVVAGLTASAGH